MNKKLYLLVGILVLTSCSTPTDYGAFCQEKGYMDYVINPDWNGWRCFATAEVMCRGNVKDTFPDGSYTTGDDYRCYEKVQE